MYYSAASGAEHQVWMNQRREAVQNVFSDEDILIDEIRCKFSNLSGTSGPSMGRMERLFSYVVSRKNSFPQLFDACLEIRTT